MSNCIDCGKLLVYDKSIRCNSCSAKITRNRLIDGRTGTRLYTIWRSMKQRCFNHNSGDYPRYGGRGITVCNRWLDYKVFKTWALSNGYKDNLSIDRINNNGNYEPSNCQWLPIIGNVVKSHAKPVNQFDLDGNLIARFNSLSEAEETMHISHIGDACKGTRKTAGGFVWRLK